MHANALYSMSFRTSWMNLSVGTSVFLKFLDLWAQLGFFTFTFALRYFSKAL